MKLLYRLLTFALVLGMVALGVLFSLQNKEPVPLDLLVYTFEPRSLSLWVLGALAIGGVLGVLASSVLLLRQRAALGSSNRKLARARDEVDRLRTAGLSSGD